MVTAIGFGDQMRVFRNVGAGRFADAHGRPRGSTGLTGGLNMVTRRLRQRRPARRAGAARRLDGRGRPVPDVAAAQPRRRLRFDDVTKAAGLLRAAADADRDLARLRRRRLPRPVRRQRVRRAGDRTRASSSQQPRRHVHRRRQGVRRRPRRLRQGRRQRRLRQRRPIPTSSCRWRRAPNRLFHNDGPRPRGSTGWRFTNVAAQAGVGAAEEQLPGDVLRLRQRRLARPLRRAATGAAPRTSPPTTSASRPAPSAAGSTATRATARSPT